MRQAASADEEGAMGDASRALSELQNARRLLDRDREDRLGRDLEDAKERIDQLRDDQRRIEEQVQNLGQPGTSGQQQMEQLFERKDELAEDITDLESDLDNMARSSRGEQMQTSRGLQESAEWIRDSKLADKVRYSKGVVQERDSRYRQQFEEGISDDLANLEQMVDEAAGNLQGSEEDRLTEALDDTRDLVRRLESFEERVREDAEGEGAGAESAEERRLGDRPGEGQDGQQGEGQEGQQGEAQGQQGQEGQQGQGGQQGEGQEGGGGGENRSPTARLGGSGNGVPGARQFAREFEERIRDAEELRDELRDQRT